MGFAIAEELANQGFEVFLISGPVQLATPKNVQRFDVLTADEMYDLTVEKFKSCDAAIMCAAVADYKPSHQAENKIKRTTDSMTIELVPNKDIAKRLGEIKTSKQRLVGFALETENEKNNALNKIRKKNLDFIVLNSLNDKGAGFKHDTNKICIINSNGEITNYELKQKREVAKDIIKKLVQIL